MLSFVKSNAAGIAIVGTLNNTALFCSSMNFIEASVGGSETTFCTITGKCLSMLIRIRITLD